MAGLELTSSSLTAEEDYALETAGFLVVSGALSAEELQAFVSGREHAHDDDASGDRYAAMFPSLAHHPVLVKYLEGIFGTAEGNWGPDGLPALCLGEPCDVRVLGSWHDELAQKPSRVPLVRGGMAPRGPLPGPAAGWGPAYGIKNGVRHCASVTAVWALTDTVPGGGYVCLSGSHKGSTPAPSGIRSGEDLLWLEQRGVATEPKLHAVRLPSLCFLSSTSRACLNRQRDMTMCVQGDLLLVVGSTVHGLRPSATLNGEQRLVECSFATGRRMTPERATAELPPPLPWTQELTEVRNLGRNLGKFGGSFPIFWHL